MATAVVPRLNFSAVTNDAGTSRASSARALSHRDQDDTPRRRVRYIDGTEGPLSSARIRRPSADDPALSWQAPPRDLHVLQSKMLDEGSPGPKYTLPSTLSHVSSSVGTATRHTVDIAEGPGPAAYTLPSTFDGGHGAVVGAPRGPEQHSLPSSRIAWVTESQSPGPKYTLPSDFDPPTPRRTPGGDNSGHLSNIPSIRSMHAQPEPTPSPRPVRAAAAGAGTASPAASSPRAPLLHYPLRPPVPRPSPYAQAAMAARARPPPAGAAGLNTSRASQSSNSPSLPGSDRARARPTVFDVVEHHSPGPKYIVPSAFGALPPAPPFVDPPSMRKRRARPRSVSPPHLESQHPEALSARHHASPRPNAKQPRGLHRPAPAVYEVYACCRYPRYPAEDEPLDEYWAAEFPDGHGPHHHHHHHDHHEHREATFITRLDMGSRRSSTSGRDGGPPAR